MTFIGFITTALVPVVFGKLTPEAQGICKGMVIVISLLMPIWIYINTQLSITKSGGDTKVCMMVDGIISLLVVPILLMLAKFTTLSPVSMYLIVKMTDFAKVAIARHEIKGEKWVVNLSER